MLGRKKVVRRRVFIARSLKALKSSNSVQAGRSIDVVECMAGNSRLESREDDRVNS